MDLLGEGAFGKVRKCEFQSQIAIKNSHNRYQSL